MKRNFINFDFFYKNKNKRNFINFDFFYKNKNSCHCLRGSDGIINCFEGRFKAALYRNQISL